MSTQSELKKAVEAASNGKQTVLFTKTGQPTFTDEECIKVNQAINRMFECHGDKVYEVVLKYVHQAMGIDPVFAVE